MRKTIALALLLLPVLVTSQERIKQYPVAGADGIVGPGGGPPAPTPPPPSCPCYSTASIQAVLDTCLTIQTNTCNPPAKTLSAFCSGPPVTNMGSWIQLTAGNECSRLYQDPETGNPAVETLPVTAEERDVCTAILTPFCPPE